MSVDRILNVVDVIGSTERWSRYAQSVKNIVPSHMGGQRYFSIYAQMIQEFLNDPKVTNKQSVLTCLFNAPKLGLNPDKVFGHIWFIPYKGVLTYQIGYKGMIQLSLNSGKVRAVRSGLVYTNDQWDYFEDEKGQHYIHRPKFETDRGNEICGYSIFEDMRGVPNIHVMESAHIDKIKALVKARMKGSSTPWDDKLFEPEMRKKTVIRRHWKTEPMSAEIAQVIESEEKNESGETASEKEVNKILDSISDQVLPSPDSEEGKKLGAELDQLAVEQQGELPFK